MVMVMSVLILSACGKSEFTTTENTGKLMTIKAENANKDDYFMIGTLEAEEGDTISITSELEKGTVRIEIYGAPQTSGTEEAPELEVEPVITCDASSGVSQSGTVPEGNYMLKATCLEKATGTVRVEVLPAE